MATQYGGTIRWVFEADDTQFNQTVDNVKDKAEELKQIVESADKSISSLGNSAKKTNSVGNFFSSIGNAVKSVSFSALTVGATAATGALTTLASKGIAATDFLETARTSMAGLTGSFEQGNAALSAAANFWQNNPFDRFSTTKATQQLIQFGRQVGQLSDDLDLLGKVSLSTNTPLDELARFYARTSASGRAMTQDIEMMSDRGIPIYRELAKQLNTTQEGVRDFASKGKIDFETFRKAMEGAVDADAMKAFEETLARQKDRMSGSISILAGDFAGYKIINDELVISEQGLEKAWTRLLKTVATALRDPALRDGMAKLGTAIAGIVDKITPVIEKAIQGLSKAINFIGDNSQLLTPIIGGILLVFGRLATKLPFIGGMFDSLAKSIGGVGKAFMSLAKANPVLAAIIGLLAGGFVSAMKNSEDFRKSIAKLFSSIGTLVSKLLPVFQQLTEAFVSIFSSPAVISTIEIIASGLAGIAEALASLPTEVLTFLVSSLLTIVALNKLSPWTVFAAGIGTAIAALSEWANAIGGIQNIPQEIGKFFASLPQEMANIGMNLINGLIKGISDASGWLFQSIGNLVNSIIVTFQRLLGIHSPSTVMAEQGEYLGLGLAEGITNSKSVAQKAMANLAKAVLQTSQKVIGNKRDFGVLDTKGQYQAWKQVSKLFVQGSEEYQSAIEQMEESRKEANLQILKLQENYNDALDNTIDKVKNFYGLFSTVSQKGGMGSSQILRNLDQQIAQLQGFSEAQNIISGLGLDEGLVEELQSMGIDAVNELQAIANMTGSELETLNSLWKQKQELANNTAVKLMENLKDSTLEQIKDIKDGIDGETIDVREVGGRLVSEISEGITGAIPTLRDAYAQLGDYIKQASKEIAKTGKAGSVSTGGYEAPLVPDTGNLAKQTKESIEESMGKLGSQLGWVAGGVLGGAILFKIGGALLNKFNKGKEIKEVTKVLKNLGGTNLASEASKAVENTKSVGKITESMGQMGQQTSKYEQVLKKVALTLAVVIEAAVAIAAVAGAIWVVNQAIPDNIGIVIPKLFVVGLAIAGMGALAWVGSKDWKNIAIGLGLILGVAFNLALVAEALGEVNKNIPDNIGIIIPKLGVVALAIAGMGALSAVAGIAWGIIGAGLIAMLGISANIALAAKAVGEIDKNIPDNVSKMPDKIGAMCLAILAFEGLSAIAGIGFAAIGLGLWGLSSITSQIIATSEALDAVNQNIPDDYGILRKKVEAMAEIIKYISGEKFGGFLENLKQSWDMAPLRSTMEMFSQCANYVGEIAKTNFNPAEINSKIDALTFVINHLAGEEIHGHQGGFLGFVGDLFGGTSYEQAATSAAKSMEALGRISRVIATEFPKEAIDTEAVKKTIGNLSEIIESIHGKFPADKDMELRGQTVDHARNLVDRLREFILSAGNLPTSIANYEDIYDTIEAGGWLVGEDIKNNFPNDSEMESRGITVDHARNLLDRLREFIISADAIPAFSNYDISSNAIINAYGILGALARSFPVDEDMESKGVTVDHARNLLDRLKEFISSANAINSDVNVSVVEQAINSFIDITTRVLAALRGKIGEFTGVGSELVQGIIQGVINKNGDIANAGNQIVITFRETIFNNASTVKSSGEKLGNEIIGGIEQSYGRLVETGRNAGNKVTDGFKEVQAATSGKFAVDGFIGGINANVARMSQTGRRLAEVFLEAFKKRAGEGSPWKTTYQSGQFAVEGLVEGLSSMQSQVVSEAELIADSVVNAFESTTPTITPEVAYAGNVAPAMNIGETTYGGARGSVIIEQTNNNYTEYDIDRVNRDLSWQLSKV